MAEEEDLSSMALTDRWVHKNWKVRKEAYETATQEFKTAQESAPIVREFVSDSGLWKGATTDSNVAAQQEGLAALCAFLEIAGKPGCTRTRNQTITPIVEKGLTGRPAAKASALEALLLYVELDVADPVLEELIPLLSSKQPKVVVATLSALTAIYHAYGCRTVNPKPVLQQFPKVYGHADKNVRAEAQNLSVEMYRWLKDAMKPMFWNELKPVQQTDLEKLFEKVKDEPAPKQERLLRSQQAIEEAKAEAGDAGEVKEAYEEEDAPEIDLEPEVIAVDVFPKIPGDFEERLSSTKWKDRKDVLDEVFALVNVPALQPGPFDNIIRGCAKSMKDANIAVVTVAANCVEAIAKGVKKPFAKYRNTILSPMLERFKEKKQSVTDAIAGACDAVFMAGGLSDILEETLEFLKHKNPLVKLESAKFLIRSLKMTKDVPQLPEVKSLADAGKALLLEGQAGPRDAGAELLGVLWKIMGDRNMLAHLEGIDDIKKNKIKEFSDAAEVKAKWKPKAAPAPAKAPAAAAGTKKPALGTKRPASTVVKRPAAPRPISPGFDEAPPMQPRPTSRPGTKPIGAKAGSATPNLKKPGLARPGMASPKRSTAVTPVEEDIPAVPAPRGLGGPGRGLAARPLGKPATSEYAEMAPPVQAPSSAMSHAERSELSDLRSEVELLRQQNSDLRTDKLRFQSQIHELQNQNAQLIEDHTRDVLSVKAKETQLVRARSDVDEAEERISSLTREVDRMKREIARLNRAERESPSYDDTPSTYSSYERTNGTNGTSRYESSSRPSHNTAAPKSYTLAHRDGPPAYTEDSGKENTPSMSLSEKTSISLTSALGRATSKPPSAASTLMEEEAAGGRASPSLVTRPSTLSSTLSSQSGSRNSSLGRSQSDGVESWRRAAEVTQHLKARIEMMKAKQNLNRER